MRVWWYHHIYIYKRTAALDELQLSASRPTKSLLDLARKESRRRGYAARKKEILQPLLKQSFALSNEDRELAHYNSIITKAYGLFLRRLTELDGKDGLQGGILAEQEDRQRGKRLELLLQRSW